MVDRIDALRNCFALGKNAHGAGLAYDPEGDVILMSWIDINFTDEATISRAKDAWRNGWNSAAGINPLESDEAAAAIRRAVQEWSKNWGEQ